ncbi:MAG TPA: MarR family transcriptional regulator [Ktedonobacterales bacterium]|jgi:DNA-binding MarR family transcriptional regulator|nr:MarR family transcriptional regulator [Ktedonobacterales bacterium]
MHAGRPDQRRLAVWKTYLQGHVAIMRALERELQAAHQLSLAEYDVLLSLYNTPEQRLRLGELAQAILFSSGGLSRLLDRLERDGLVARERTPDDRRGVCARLTEAGRARLRAASVTHLRGIQSHFAAALPENEIETVSGFFDRLLARTPVTPAQICETEPESSPQR